MKLNQKTRQIIYFCIFVAYELLIVMTEVGILAILFVLPTLLGIVLKPYLGDLVGRIGLVVGVALFGVAYVQRKKTLQQLQLFFRNKYAHTIVRLSKSKYFKNPDSSI